MPLSPLRCRFVGWSPLLRLFLVLWYVPVDLYVFRNARLRMFARLTSMVTVIFQIFQKARIEPTDFALLQFFWNPRTHPISRFGEWQGYYYLINWWSFLMGHIDIWENIQFNAHLPYNGIVQNYEKCDNSLKNNTCTTTHWEE